jgi:PAS domain S-box-containing protein
MLLSRDRRAKRRNRSMEELVHTLQVQRVELEIQNDELRRTQLALEESRDRYLDLYEFAPVAYLTLASSGQIAETNLTTAALLGVERQQLLGQHFTGLVASDDRERWQRLFRGLTRTDAAQNAELALMRGNGTVFHALVNCRRVATEQRDPVVRLTLTDISEHQQIEDARHFLLECGNRHASEDFFKSLAQYLAQSLQMDYVCIDRLEGDSLHAHTLAVYADGAFEDNVSYALQDTPLRRCRRQSGLLLSGEGPRNAFPAMRCCRRWAPRAMWEPRCGVSMANRSA